MEMVLTSPIRMTKREKKWLERTAKRRKIAMTLIIRELIQAEMAAKK